MSRFEKKITKTMHHKTWKNKGNIFISLTNIFHAIIMTINIPHNYDGQSYPPHMQYMNYCFKEIYLHIAS